MAGSDREGSDAVTCPCIRRSRSRATACIQLDQIHDVTPSANGCGECPKSEDSQVQLRMCLVGGHVGCRASSKNKLATAHLHSTSHPVIEAFKAGQDWSWCYVDDTYI